VKDKYLQLIDKQIEKLSAQDFDLDAWKSSTIYLLSRIFGPSDQKINEINNLKIDYSSWALRDSNAKYKPIETCKRKGKEILEIAKDEIELFGVENSHTKFDNKLKELFNVDQYQQLISPETPDTLKTETLKSLTKEKLVALIKICL